MVVAPPLHSPEMTQRFKYLIANTSAIIYSSVPSGDFKMTFVSENAQRILGYDPQEMVDDPNFWFDHIHPDDAPTVFSSLAQLFVEGQRAYEYRFMTKAGHYLWMHDTLRLIRDEQNNPVEVIGSLTDITDRKLMEEALQRTGEEQLNLINQLTDTQAQLLQSEKMASIGQLAAGVAHEINNPIGFVNSNMRSLQTYVDTLLNVIGQQTSMLLSDTVGADIQHQAKQLNESADLSYLQNDVKDLMSESLDGLKRVKDIVQSLKDFSHVGESEWQMVDIHKGLDSTLTIASNEFKYKAVVEKHYGDLPQVKGLASQLNQVFMNLLVNAAHAIAERGTISIATECRDQWVYIRFTDSGCGIPEENMARIFEPFFTTKPIGSGTGLGLSLSYGILQKHGGRIEVQSTVGTGTTFTICLPVEQGTTPA
ncbi:ATP-binding protein [Herbaspirillum sp. RTI4]|uniref:ATP-binding protein n=1 Tax=Herbaspirillum sp. RTI4 TaxID=3048640 RepID=UPI002AB34816|nr:ATP-binding protein [Herbaspirillum sp. RTI4]MDY7579659.1 ATP-binding protein [Herbaspirillum sp. RTI4]MEA9981874.1 ATP-binding protein [Herbaspirillum sp. RTI4]